MYAIDFETEAIDDTSATPPRPVGVALSSPDSEPIYMAWGHPTGNNCTLSEARQALSRLWGGDLVMHNAKFDLAVAKYWLDLPCPAWDKLHDTMFLAYLLDPNATSLGLKPLAEHYLHLAPEERDLLKIGRAHV